MAHEKRGEGAKFVKQFEKPPRYGLRPQNQCPGPLISRYPPDARRAGRTRRRGRGGRRPPERLQARSAIFAGGPKADAPTPPPKLVKDLAEIARLRELSRIGTNLNQIARWLNAFDPAADDLGRVIEKLRAIETIRGWIDQETPSRRRRRQ